MSDGETHYKYYKRGMAIAVPLSVATAFINPAVGLGMLTGYGLGRWIDPDWDGMGTNMAEGRMVRELGVVGYIFFGVSSVYGAVFRRHHRSFITHFPFVSTMIRLLWTFWLASVPWIVGYLQVQMWQVWFLLGVWVGLSLADTIHWWLDYRSGELRKSKQTLRKSGNNCSKIRRK